MLFQSAVIQPQLTDYWIPLKRVLVSIKKFC